MKAKILILSSILSFNLVAQVYVQNVKYNIDNSYLVVTGNNKFVNNGGINFAGASTVKFTGAGNIEIKGDSVTNFKNLEIDKAPGNKVILKRNANVLGTLSMQNGILDLKDYILNLSTTGMIIGENENSRIIATDINNTEGSGNGKVKAIRDNPSGNVAGLGLDFTPFTDMGSTTIYRGHLQQSGYAMNGNSIWRYYEIHPTTYANLTINDFYFFDAELNGNTPVSDLKVMQLYNEPDIWQISPTTINDVSAPNPNTAQSNTQSNSLSYIKITIAKPSCNITATASSNSPQCEGDTLNLSVVTSGGTGVLTYNWTGPNGFSSTQQNPLITNVTTAYSGIYYVTVTDELNCTATSEINVTINSNPVAIVEATPYLICEGSDLSLSSSAGESWSWSGPNGFSSINQNPTIYNITTANSGIYTVTITQANGCTREASLNVTVNINPEATASALVNPVCEGSDLNLTSTSGESWNWSGPGGFNSNVQNPVITNVGVTNSGFYFVTITQSNGCTRTASVDVIVNPLPNVVISATDSVICNGATITLISSGANTYQWSTGETGNSIEVTPSVTTIYYVTGTDIIGCSNTANIEITVNSLPDVYFTGLLSEYCQVNQNILLVGNHSLEGVFSGSGIVAGNIFNPYYSTPGINQITYTYTDPATGCTNIATQSVTIHSVPSLNYSIISQPTCGQCTGIVELSGAGGTPPYTFSTGSAIMNNVCGGLYIVSITDANGCQGQGSVTVSQLGSPQVELVSSSASECPSSCNGTAQISITGGTAPYNIMWNNGSSSTLVTDLCTGINYVEVTDANNCITSLTVNTGYNESDPILYGQIVYSGGSVYSENAKLLLFSTTQQYCGGYDTLPTLVYGIANDGTFYITNVKPDSYIIKVTVPQEEYPQLANTYYDQNTPTNEWAEAEVVDIQCNTITQLNIQMYEFEPIGQGEGYIEGQIFYIGEDGEGVKGVYIKGDRASDEPVEGIEVFVKKQPSGKSVKLSITDGNGMYNFTDLEEGEYSLLVEIPGFPMMSTYNITIDQTNTSYTGLDFVLDTTAYEGYIDTIQVYTSTIENPVISFAVYPNPFKDEINVYYRLNEVKNVKIELISNEGRILRTTPVMKKGIGEYEERINLFTTTDEVYFIKITFDKMVYVKKLIKVK